MYIKVLTVKDESNLFHVLICCMLFLVCVCVSCLYRKKNRIVSSNIVVCFCFDNIKTKECEKWCWTKQNKTKKESIEIETSFFENDLTWLNLTLPQTKQKQKKNLQKKNVKNQSIQCQLHVHHWNPSLYSAFRFPF